MLLSFGAIVAVACALVGALAGPLAAGDSFGEELLLRAHADGTVAAYFQWHVRAPAVDATEPHYRMLARDLGPLALSRETPRTRLSFTQGRWRYREWGVPVVDVASSGVSVTVDVATANGTAAAGTSETVWKRIVAHLAGVFCASLHELDASRVVEPRQTFREKAHGSDAHSGEDNGMRPNDSGSTLFGTLPRETVCTENLTPWMKLLPCNGRTGLARLLNPYRIYDADYNSMTMDVRSRCSVNGGTGTSGKECLAYDVDATFGLVLVIDPLRVGDSRGNMMDEQAQALGDQSQTVHVLPTLDCSLRSLFDRTLPTAQCPGTTVSRVLIEMDGRDAAELVTKADTTLMTKVDRHSSWAVYDMLREGREYDDVGLRYANPQPPSVVASVASDSDTPVPTTPFFVDRRLTGHGEQHGGLAVTLTNHGAKPVRCIYLDILPWFMRVYMHTLSVDVISIAPAASTTRRSRVNDLAALATNLHYQPAIDRHRPSVIEMTLDIPARSTVTLHVDFDKALLRYTEYPPDANRGFDLGGAVVTVAPGADRHLLRTIWASSLEARHRLTSFNLPDVPVAASPPLVIHTPNLLLSLPTPDFSMPYNVITLSCTVIALFFGGIVNMLLRSFQPVVDAEKRGLVARLIGQLKAGRKRGVALSSMST